MNPDILYDQMIGIGAARKLVFSYGGNPGVGSLHRFRDAIEHGWPRPIELEEHSHAGMANRYAAGAARLPFAVMHGYVGTDLQPGDYHTRQRFLPLLGSGQPRSRRVRPVDARAGAGGGAGAVSEVTSAEIQTIAAARRLEHARSVFIGVGRPSTAAILARMVHNPELVLVYESGAIGAKPYHIPLSIGDGELAETADAVVSVPEMFNYWIGPGRIEVAFLGAAQVDRHGNLNSTVIAEYDHTPRRACPAPAARRRSRRAAVRWW
jgi:acyl CoA:acetate/3-ketoacid CoA transferase alpha subunit